jgi:hypothetical protein
VKRPISQEKTFPRILETEALESPVFVGKQTPPTFSKFVPQSTVEAEELLPSALVELLLAAFVEAQQYGMLAAQSVAAVFSVSEVRQYLEQAPPKLVQLTTPLAGIVGGQHWLLFPPRHSNCLQSVLPVLSTQENPGKSFAQVYASIAELTVQHD